MIFLPESGSIETLPKAGFDRLVASIQEARSEETAEVTKSPVSRLKKLRKVFQKK
jgi:hypothetical protein